MRLRIHRGAKEIGGSCVELNAEGHSILLDLGLPLDCGEADASLLPAIPNLTGAEGLQAGGPIRSTGDPALAGVVVSHTHPDHIGLTGLLAPEIPVFVGEKAARLMTAAQAFLPRLALPGSVHTYTDRQPFRLGPFTITPHLTDHSAFDAYSLLVEAAGRRVFYSGDLRAHGRKAHLVERLIRHRPRDLDALILEGTTLSREDHVAQSEQDLENDIMGHIRGSPGLVLAAFSAQNIDRFVTIYKATLRAGRVFVGDAYLVHLLCTLELPTLPLPNLQTFRVYLPHSQRRRILADQAFELVECLRHARIFNQELAKEPSRYVLLFRESMARELGPLVSTTSATPTLLYSLWPGYLDRNGSELRTWCDSRSIPLIICHTSGHADLTTLIRLARGLDARHVIPIHTTAPHRFRDFFQNAMLLNDGEWFEL